jgi:hypothetical protein
MEAEVKEFIVRDLWSITAIIILTYVFTGFLYIVGSAFGGSSGSLSTSSNIDPFAYRAVGSSIVVLSMMILSAMGQYIYSSMLSGRLEALLASPISLSAVLVVTAIPMMIFGLSIFMATAAPAIYIALSKYGVITAIGSIAIIAFGMIPLFILGFLLSIAIAKLGSPVILNLLQAFIFTFSGALYPLIILPELLRLLPLSLPTYYIAEALRGLISSESQSLALGGEPRLLIVTLAYGSIGSILYRRFSRSIRGGVAA